MKRLLVVVGLLIVVAGVACDNPNSPSTTLVFTAQLSPANEVPPVTNADATASGTATITFNNLVYNSSDVITSGTVDFQVTMTGFPLATNVTAAHIHTGAVGTAGAVLLDTGLSAAGGLALVTGAGSFSRTGISATADTLNAIKNNPAGFYFNVHTQLTGTGAIRGQLVKQ